MKSPSPRQLQALSNLKKSKNLMLQLHWKWTDKGTAEPALADCVALLTRLKGRELSRSQCDSLFIGQDFEGWDLLGIWTLPDKGALEALITSDEFKRLSNLAEKAQVLVLSPLSKMVNGVLTVAGAVLRRLPSLGQTEIMPDDMGSGGINPTQQQHEAFMASNQQSRMHVFNLLKFKPEADYHEPTANTLNVRTGEKAYNKGYGSVAIECILRLGGKVVALANYRFTLIGEAGDPALGRWDQVAVIQYPSRTAFMQMVMTEKYQKSITHREAGLSYTSVWATSPAQV